MFQQSPSTGSMSRAFIRSLRTWCKLVQFVRFLSCVLANFYTGIFIYCNLLIYLLLVEMTVVCKANILCPVMSVTKDGFPLSPYTRLGLDSTVICEYTTCMVEPYSFTNSTS